MEQSQIIRLPRKYWELFSTLSNEEAWKLIKELFWYDAKIDGLTRVYRDMIWVDINNMETSAKNWIKWGRPKNKKTPGYWKSKPQVIENDNLNEEKIKEKKWNEEKISEEKKNGNKKKIEEKIENLPEWVRKDFFEFLLEHINFIEEEYSDKKIESIENKVKEFWEILWVKIASLEIESFISHHRNNKTVFKDTIGRLNTWLANKIK